MRTSAVSRSEITASQLVYRYNHSPEIRSLVSESLNTAQYAPLSLLPEDRIEAVIAPMPKPRLHEHGDLSLDPEEWIELHRRHGFTPPADSAERLGEMIQMTRNDRDFQAVLPKFSTASRLYKSPELIRDMIAQVVVAFAAEKTPYVELRFSAPFMAPEVAQQRNVDPRQVFEPIYRAVIEGSRLGVQRAKEPIEVRLIAIVDRTHDVDEAQIVADLAAKYRNEGIVGLDLASDESRFPPGPFAKVFQEKHKDLFGTVHAGEAGPAENIRVAIETLRADRIGHGVRAFQDPAVEALVRRFRVPLELCLTSNIKTKAVDSLESYPLSSYLKPTVIAGEKLEPVVVTLSTDDAGLFPLRGTSRLTILDEYLLGIGAFGLSFHDVQTISLNSVKAAFVRSAAAKRTIRRQVQREMQEVKTDAFMHKLSLLELMRLVASAPQRLRAPRSNAQLSRQLAAAIDGV